jgi:hypothetical protein
MLLATHWQCAFKLLFTTSFIFNEILSQQIILVAFHMICLVYAKVWTMQIIIELTHVT